MHAKRDHRGAVQRPDGISPRPARAGESFGEADLMEEERSRFQFIVNASRDLISFVDTDYVYRAVNSAYQKIYGRGKDQIIGLSVADMWGREKFESLIKSKFDRCFQGHETQDQDWIDCGPTGLRFMDVTYHPFRGPDGGVHGAGVTSHDITDLKRAEETVRESESRYRALVETSSDLIISTDPEGDYTFLNPAAKEVFKEKKNYLVFVHREDLERTRTAWDELLVGTQLRDFENRIQGRDQKLRHIAWSASPLKGPGGKVVGCIAIGRDVSPKKKLESLVAELMFTPREAEILRLVIQGYTNLNIAASLGIREGTVKFHLNSIFRKTGVQNRTELAMLVR